MAEKGTPKSTTTVEVPEGMTPEQFQRLFTTFAKGQVHGKAVGQAMTATLGELKKRHAAEYVTILSAEYKKRGLDPSKIRGVVTK